ncbi:UDP-N-acetylmuramoyl-tripeptide--D-alanyl-D-alanine ligase [Megalodesulfovibrio paquesii]
MTGMILGQIAAAMQGVLSDAAHADRAPTCIATDSRTVSAGALFFCIKGERFDGHDFIRDVAAKGALAAVVEQDVPDAPIPPIPPIPLIRVDAVLPALGRLALAHRRQFAGKVVGVTGSAGKTTVKELLAHLLAGLGPVAKNARNLNNHIGLPTSMLAATGEEAFWVMETGVNFVGDMDPLAAMLEPDLVVAVNAGAAHLEGLHDVATVAREKCKLVRALREGGMAVANADIPELRQAVLDTGKPVRWFSTVNAAAADYHCEFQGCTETGGRFALALRGEGVVVDAPFAAPFLAQSLAAAAGTAHALGVPAQQIAGRLATAQLPDQRFQATRVGRWLLIDDSYNANPLSMAAVLEAARVIAGPARLVAVLGEMRELGEMAEAAHKALGAQLTAAMPAAVFWTGGQGGAVTAGLRDAGGETPVRMLESPEAFAESLAALFDKDEEDVVVLFKGSRSNKLERYVAALRAVLEGAC